MRTRPIFRPAEWNLESRVLLSTGLAQRPALIRMSAASKRSAHQTTRDAIEQSFRSFQTDYFQAQETYLQKNNTPLGQTAFINFTTQRVYQLSQELGGSLNRIAISVSKGQSVASLRPFLNSRILSPQSKGSLLGGLLASTPPSGTDPNAAQLFTAAASSAISAAETASSNAIGSLHSGAYTGNKHDYHK